MLCFIATQDPTTLDWPLVTACTSVLSTLLCQQGNDASTGYGAQSYGGGYGEDAYGQGAAQKGYGAQGDAYGRAAPDYGQPAARAKQHAARPGGAHAGYGQAGAGYSQGYDSGYGQAAAGQKRNADAYGGSQGQVQHLSPYLLLVHVPQGPMNSPVATFAYSGQYQESLNGRIPICGRDSAGS